MPDIAQSIADVTGRIARAAAKANRDPGEITLITVSKTRSIDEIRQAVDAGATDLGENYVQELVDKSQQFGADPDSGPRWHAIGHLQRNKVKYIVPFCALIHSVESTRLADEIDKRALQAGRIQPVLIEVNVAGEDSKFGLTAEEVAPLAHHIAGLSNTQLSGLMAMTPYGVGDDEARRYFSAVRELAGKLSADLPEGAMDNLSMGMTQDFEVAVEEGATLVRVGTAIFGRRDNA